MRKITVLLAIGMLFVASAQADANKGKKVYMKKMKSACGFSGAKFAMKHTQQEWSKFNKAGAIAQEAAKICPGLKLKGKYTKDVYDFSYKYAKDSGNVPSC